MNKKSSHDLISKYSTQGPRYTSYPPVPYWKGAPTEEAWISEIKKNYMESQGLDLYVHIPFCESLCYYCGCNRVITKNHEHENEFIESILHEWQIYKTKLGFSPKINSLHLGGGTPTFISAKNLDFLLKSLLLSRSEDFIGSVEIDPRTCTDDHLKTFIKHSIFRTSLGIQDFNQNVQEAIHRFQSPKMIQEIVLKMRNMGFSSINFDLIYGLPRQTRETISETMKHVLDLKPDMIAFYSYAHLPDKIKNQKLIHTSDLPGPQQKRALYERGKDLLNENYYYNIGMDHFALEDNFLFKAKKSNNLFRNFMGYVDKKSSLLIGLGPSSISDSSHSFSQNLKNVKDYQNSIRKGYLAIEKGHKLSREDLIVQGIIQRLLCQGEINLDQIKELPFHDLIQAELHEFYLDGLIEIHPHGYAISNAGEPFARNMAMTFDFHLRRQQNQNHFSQTI
jgi:oxygen-independent coproporphyrinogen-3 oxidase